MNRIRALLIRSIGRLHHLLFRASGGRLMAELRGMPVVMLTTIGRKSGRRHVTMLTSPLQEGDGFLVVASYGGSGRHPAWFLNLRERPEVEVVAQGRQRRMRARILSAAQKAARWPRVVERYPSYAAYQQRTPRDIPLVMLEPASE